MILGRNMEDFWTNFGRIMNNLSICYGQIPDINCTSFGIIRTISSHTMTIFRRNISGHNMDGSWMWYGRFLTFFILNFQKLNYILTIIVLFSVDAKERKTFT